MGTGLVRAWTIGMLAMLFASIDAPARAASQAGSVGEPVTLCVRRVARGVRIAHPFADLSRFDCRNSQLSFGPGSFHLMSTALDVGRSWPARVRTAGAWQERMTLYALYADGAVVAMPTDGRGVSRRLQLGAIVEHTLPVRGIPVVRLAWHVEGASNLRGIVLDPRVATPTESARSSQLLAGFFGLFAGVCAALLACNLALWAALRQRYQLTYCAMLASLIVYAAAASGAVALVWPDIANNDRLRIDYVSLAVAAAAALSFARSYFEPRVFAGWLGRASSAAGVGVVATSLLLAAFQDAAPRFLDRLYTSSFLFLVVLIAPILGRAWTQRSGYLWLFAIGWAAPVAFAGVQIAYAFGLIDWSFWVDNTTAIAMMAEAVLCGLAVAYRIHLLARDRDRALEDERAARLLAATDPLTGLLNRRAFLAQAIGRTGRQTLLILDLDHFKRVNETIGHDGGDDVLRLVATFLQEATPPGALVARIGGEEFAIVLDAGVEIDPARLLAELRARRMPFDIELTASIGVCAGPLARETDWKALYRGADQALFDAKASGRDRVRRAAPALA